MINNQNMTVFIVELGFTALPHLPDSTGARRFYDFFRASKSKVLLIQSLHPTPRSGLST
jgi:hypothetical protein